MAGRADNEGPLGETLEIIFHQVRQQLALQWSAIDSVDTKAGIVIAAVGVIFAALFTGHPTVETTGQQLWFGMVLGLLISAILCAIASFGGRPWNEPPEPGLLYRKYARISPDQLKETLVLTWIRAFERNRALLNTKLYWFQFWLILLGLAVLLGIVCIAISV